MRRDTAGDSDVRSSHAKFEGLILPWNDSFWKTNSAPMDFGCRCDDIQTDEPVNKIDGYEEFSAGKGFDFNPYFDRKIIAPSAGYYQNVSETKTKELDDITTEYLNDYLK
jgi:hypothetical protein